MALSSLLTEGEIEEGCDNIEALQWAINTDYFVSPNHTHFDFMTAIRYHVKQSPLRWKTCHVQGHQDDNPFITLDQWAKLNVEVDALAKAYLQVILQERDRDQQQ